ncbi:cytochrome c oxidase accessory protein CcoG [Hydrogenophaga aromaticivorans]|uniref:cytochrome c oxidase accessory protein CcoG n=1 Tax=Hydrogenophaga aromaticivorans TaxID=2610898 RepID=UPI001B38170B|nr:cytochrome c oxidase accessory protein CcoG [Hydrogenophaga aromaticivorans]MBQ0917213.1 cytochrome c oxidase accessory protein CcoG [Hydrogenophaga aromaticivorans]
MSTPTRTIPIVSAARGPSEDKIQMRSITGVFTRWRWAMVWLTQALFYGLPWLTMHGRQAVLFDLQADRFFLFGAVLYPQDLIYLAGLLVISALLLFFATTLAGRVWCGFACPQTVYTELFQWIEHRTEGDRQARLRLDRSPWNGQKLLRRGSKHLAWALLALWTGFTLVGYFTPIRELAQAVPHQLGPWESFWISFYGLATYGNAGFLRESVCQHMCPYGRFQGSLMDASTLYVAYDERRGEPRAPRPRGSDPVQRGSGACVDCTLCVQVCPVGIDIRQGLQAACISCGLCIDACNQVMDKLRAPRGLIRLASERELSHAGTPALTLRAHLGRRRVIVYGGLIALASTLMVLSFIHRPTLRLNAVRDRAVLARQVENGAIENVYRLQLMNASERPRDVQVDVTGAHGLRLTAPARVHLAAAGAHMQTVTLRLPPEQARVLAGQVLPIRIGIAGTDGHAIEHAETSSTFMVPR